MKNTCIYEKIEFFEKKVHFLKSPHLTQKVGLRGTLRPMYLGNFRMIRYSRVKSLIQLIKD